MPETDRNAGTARLLIVVPVAIAYQNELIQSVEGLHRLLPKDKSTAVQTALLKEVAGHIADARNGIAKLRAALKSAYEEENELKKAKAYCHNIKPILDAIRVPVDALEGLVPDSSWPLLKYEEMLFLI